MSSGRGGHTAGRGGKGQTARSGYKRPRPGFEGGQMPLARRLPTLKGFTRGFVKSNLKKYTFGIGEIAELLEGGEVNIERLLEVGLLRPESKKVSIKILFDKQIDCKLDIVGIPVSKQARIAIESAGGSVK